MKKTESISDFLARGGKITVVQTQPTTFKPESTKSSNTGGPATILTMGEADLFYGEYRPKKATKKVRKSIDISALPEELRKKYIDEVLLNGEENEEE